MNNLEHSWTSLAAAARRIAAEEPVPAAPPGWAARVAAVWMAERRSGAEAPAASLMAAWSALALPACAIAMVISGVTIFSLQSRIEPREAGDVLVALADPLERNSVLP